MKTNNGLIIRRIRKLGLTEKDTMNVIEAIKNSLLPEVRISKEFVQRLAKYLSKQNTVVIGRSKKGLALYSLESYVKKISNLKGQVKQETVK